VGILSEKRGEIEIQNARGVVRVSFPPSRVPAASIFMLVWAVPIGILAITWWPDVIAVLRDQWKEGAFGEGDLFFTFVLTMLTWGMLRVLLELAWLHTGREELIVTAGLVSSRRRLGPLAWRRKKLGKLETVAVTPDGKLAVGVNGRTFFLGSGISSAEAARILSHLRLKAPL
jgi:hypothetical protein